MKNPFSYILNSLHISDSDVRGRGVYAGENVPKDTLLIVFGGHVMTRDEEERLPLNIRDAALQIDRNLVIGAKETSEIGIVDYVNHSCEPNAGIKGQISLYAMRDIKKGKEIRFDYGTILFRAEGAPKYILECKCGSNKCRQNITQFDWMNPTIWRYDPYLPYFIREEIAKLKLQNSLSGKGD